MREMQREARALGDPTVYQLHLGMLEGLADEHDEVSSLM